jgi:tetratricopeptide (TPR) repeat protein
MIVHAILFCINLLAATCSAVTNQELLLQGNKYYMANTYDKALECYHKITHKSPAVWYNMGNVAFKKENLIAAILYWKRAQKDADWHLYQQCGQQCAHAYTMLNQKTAHISENFWSLCQRILLAIPMLAVQILFFLLFSILLVLNYYWFLRKKRIRCIACSLCLVAVIGIMHYGMQLKKATFGLIMNPDVVLYAGPDQHYHQKAVLPAGTSIRILQQKDDWAKIAWRTHSGWVMKTELEII